MNLKILMVLIILDKISRQQQGRCQNIIFLSMFSSGSEYNFKGGYLSEYWYKAKIHNYQIGYLVNIDIDL